jgi:hypothetical protein
MLAKMFKGKHIMGPEGPWTSLDELGQLGLLRRLGPADHESRSM